MKSFIRTICFFGFVILLGRCQKAELPPPEEGTPVFTLDAAIDGVPLRITAGDSSYVMRASFEEDTAGVPLYRGAFRELGCTGNCLPSVSFFFRGAAPGPARPDTVLRVGTYAFRYPDTPTIEIIYRAAFSGIYNASSIDAPIAYFWDFGDGATSSLQNPEHEYVNGEPRLVRLQTTNAGGCVSFKEKKIGFGFLPVPCEVDFTIQPPQGATPAQAVITGPLDIYDTWAWFSGDSSLVTSYPIGQLAPQELREVCLTAQNTEGCRSQTCKTVFLNNVQDLGFCATDFNYQASIEAILVPAPEQYGTVWIEYVDGAGRLFSSALGPQDTLSGDFFQVTAQEPFEANESGQPTKKLEVAFQCRLYGAGGQSAGTFSGTGVIAVAHP